MSQEMHDVEDALARAEQMRCEDQTSRPPASPVDIGHAEIDWLADMLDMDPVRRALAHKKYDSISRLLGAREVDSKYHAQREAVDFNAPGTDKDPWITRLRRYADATAQLKVVGEIEDERRRYRDAIDEVIEIDYVDPIPPRAPRRTVQIGVDFGADPPAVAWFDPHEVRFFHPGGETTRSRSTKLQPALTQTRPMDDQPGRGIIPRHIAKLLEAIGAPEGTELEQRYSPVLKIWCLDITLPGRAPIRVWERRTRNRTLADEHASNWGGLYDLRSLAQIGIAHAAAQRGGYC